MYCRSPDCKLAFLSQRAARCVIDGAMPALPRLPSRRLLREFVCQNALFCERGRIHSVRLKAAPSIAKQTCVRLRCSTTNEPFGHYKENLRLSLNMHAFTVKGGGSDAEIKRRKTKDR